MDALTKLSRQKRKVDTRVTNGNKDMIIKEINKNMSDFGYGKIPKTASIQEVQRMKKQYMDRLTYDIVTLAVQQGKSIIAEIESRDLRKSEDSDSKKLASYAKDLAKAKKESNKKLTKNEVQFLERGNNNIKGYGNSDIISLFEKSKNKKEIEELIKDVKEQDTKKIFYDKQKLLIDRAFQKIGIVREEDLNKIKSKLDKMDFQDALNHSNYLLNSLETYDSGQGKASNGDETELANARLDDMMIQLDLKKTGKQKVKKVLNKYK